MQVQINTAVEAIEESKKRMKGIKIPEIKTKEDNIIATNSLNLIKSNIKTTTNDRLKITRLIDESKKGVILFFAPHLAKLESYKNQLDINMKVWYEKEQKLLREQEEKIAAENKRKQDEIDRRIEKAKKPETKERLAEEKDIIENTQTVIIPEKTEGGYWMKIWKWNYKNGFDANSTELKKQLLDKFPHLILIDESGIGKLVKQTKDTLVIDGIDPYEDNTWVTK